MPENFSDLYIGKSYEEIREMIKNQAISFYRYGLERSSNYIEECKKNHQEISREVNINYDLFFKSLENSDEAVDASMREMALKLYNEVRRLNQYCGDRSNTSKSKAIFQNIMNHSIFPIINGFGEQSRSLFELIANTAFVDPTEVFHIYTRMKGIDAITPAEFTEQASNLLYRHDLSHNEVAELAELEVRRASNVHFGLLTKTKEELIQEITKQYGSKSIQL